jgi:hypothetical protein
MNTNIQLTEQEMAMIRKATETGTPNFDQAAHACGSKVYCCSMDEAGLVLDSTVSSKNWRVLVTEQDMRLKPAMVWFYYAQFPPYKVFEDLAELVSPYLQSKRNDLLQRDYHLIVENNNSTPFVYAYRDSGSDLLHMPPTLEEAIDIDGYKKQGGLETDEETRADLAIYFRNQIDTTVRQNQHYLYFSGSYFRVATAEDISKIYLDHFSMLIANWKTSSLQLVRVPQTISSTQNHAQ